MDFMDRTLSVAFLISVASVLCGRPGVLSVPVQVQVEFGLFPLSPKASRYTLKREGMELASVEASSCVRACVLRTTMQESAVAVAPPPHPPPIPLELQAFTQTQLLHTTTAFSISLINSSMLKGSTSSTGAVLTWPSVGPDHRLSVCVSDKCWPPSHTDASTHTYQLPGLRPAMAYAITVEQETQIRHLGIAVLQKLQLIIETAQCPLGWLAVGWSCFRVWQGVHVWSGAHQACAGAAPGVHLADIHTEAELQVISAHLLSHSHLLLLWTALNDLQVEGLLKWSDGSPYNLSAPVMSLLSANETDCFALQRNATGPSYFLTSFFCDMALPYLCHAELLPTPVSGLHLVEVGETSAVLRWDAGAAADSAKMPSGSKLSLHQQHYNNHDSADSTAADHWLPHTPAVHSDTNTHTNIASVAAIDTASDTPIDTSSHTSSIHPGLRPRGTPIHTGLGPRGNVTVVGLAPGHLYRFSLRATYPSGASQTLGPLLDVYTRPNPPRNITAGTVTANHISLRWVTLDSSQNARYQQYTVRWWEAGSGERRSLRVDGNETGAAIGGLLAYQEYRISVVSVTAQGVESCELPPITVVTVSISELGRTTLRVCWEAPSGQVHDGYLLALRPLSQQSPRRELWVNNSLCTTLSMLRPGETYEVGVARVRDQARSEETTGQHTLMSEGVQFAMLQLLFTNSVDLYLPPASVYDGVLVSHAHNTSWSPVARGDDKVTVGNLSPGSEYDLTLFVTSGGRGSDGYRVPHAKTCLASPRRVREGRVTDRAIEILWEPAEGQTHTYEAMCLDCTATVMVQKVVEQRAVFSGFTPGQVFNFSVRSEKESYKDSPPVFLAVRAAPSAIVLLLPQDRTTSAITVSWREGPGLCDGFLLSISNVTFHLLKMQNISEPRVHCFDDLSPGSDYLIEVTSLSGGKKSDATSVTVHTVPVPPQEVFFIEQEVSSMYVRWTPPPGRAEGFWVQYVLMPGSGSGASVPRDARVHGSSSISLRDLSPGSDYELSIRTILGQDISDAHSTHFSTLKLSWQRGRGHYDFLRVALSNLTASWELRVGGSGSGSGSRSVEGQEVVVGGLRNGCPYNATLQRIRGELMGQPTTLNIHTEPLSPAGVYVSSVWEHGFSIHWEEADGCVEQYQLRLSPDHGTSNITHTQADVGGLTPSTSYTVTLNAVSPSANSAPVSRIINTNATAPSAPNELEGERVGSTGILLSWRTPLDDTVQSFVIQYKQVCPHPDPAFSELILNLHIPEFLLNTLVPGATYNIKVGAENRDGVRSFSKSLFIKTAEAPPGLVTNLTAVPENHTFVKVTWYLPKRINGLITKFAVKAKHARTGQTVEMLEVNAEDIMTGALPHCNDAADILSRGTPSPEEFTSASAPPVTLSAVPPASSWAVPISVGMASLRPYTAYVFEVSAFTSDGEGQIASTMTRTPESAPEGPPENLVVGNVTSQSASLSWEPPAVLTGRFSYVLELYGPTGLVFENSTGDLKFVYSGLVPYTAYIIRVRAKVAGGPDALGPDAETYIRTTAEAPSAVSELTAEAVDSTSVRLFWRTPTQPNGPITRYRIRVLYSNLTVQDITLHGLMGSGNWTDDNDDDDGMSLGRSHSRSRHRYRRYGRYGRSADLTTPSPVSMFTLSALPPHLRTAAQQSHVTGLTSSATADQLTHGNNLDPDLDPADPTNTPTLTPALSLTTAAPPLHTALPWLSFTPDSNSTDSSNNNTATDEPVTMPMPSDLPALTWGTDEQPRVSDATASGHTLHTRAATRVAATTGGIEGNNAAATTGGIEVLPASEEVVDLSDEMLYVVGSLRPFTEYSFSVSAYTPVGQGPEAHISETTREQVPSSVQEVAYQNISSTSILVTWSPPLSPNGQITHYTAYLLNLETQKSQAYTAANTSALITDLEKYTSYTLRVTASTMVGESPVSEEDHVYVKTLEDEPDSPPRDLVLMDATSSTVTVSWQPPDRPNGIIRQYEVSYGNGSFLHALNTSGLSLTLRQLRPYTLYNVTVRAYTHLGHGEQESDTLEILSGEDVPGSPPYGLSYESLSPSEVNVSWAAPLHPNGLILQYHVELWNATHTLNLSTPEPHLLITHLRKYARYRLAVQAATRMGTGNHYSEILNITTLEDVPSSPPQSLLALRLSDSEVLLSWAAPEEANSEILYYVVRVWNLSHEFVQNVTGTSIVVTVDTEDLYNASVSSWTRLVPSDPPQNVSISDVTRNSFNVSWLPPTQPNGILMHYTIYYSDNNTVNMQRVPVPMSWWVVSEGVSVGVAYTVWLTSSTAAGDGGVASPPINITTLEDVPSGPIHNLSSTTHGSTALVITWDPPLEPNGQVFYLLSLSEAGTTHPSFNRTANRTITKTTTDTIFLFTKLRKYFPYVFTVTPATGAGPALNHTSVMHVRTDEDVPSSPPLPASSRNLSFSSIYVRWAEPAEPNGDIIEYVAVLQGAGLHNTTYTPHTHLTLTHLTPYTPYNLSVAAINSKGMGPSLLLALHTDEAGPMSPPLSLEIFNHTSDSVWLRWEASLEPNGQVQHYGFRILDLNTHTLRFQNSTGPGTEAELLGFRPHRMYEISVCTYTRAGNGDLYSDPVIFTTNESVADAVFSLSCSGVGWDSVLMRWEPPANPNGEIQHYLVQSLSTREEVVPSETDMDSASAIAHTVSGLWPNTLYNISVSAVNSAGPGEWSNCTAYTHQETAPGPPVGLRVSEVQPSSVTLLWAPPASLPGRLLGYRLVVQLLLRGCHEHQGQGSGAAPPQPQPQPGASCLDTEVVVNATVMGVNATGENETLRLHPLRKFREYRFSLAAYTGAGMGPDTEWVYTHTLAGDPEFPPRAVNVSSTSSELTIQWEPPKVITGPTSYLVHISAMDGSGLNWTVLRRPEDARVVVHGNLSSSTLYWVTVTAFTGEQSLAQQNGKASAPEKITTKAREPKDPPKDVSLIRDPGEVTRVRVMFSPPENHHGNISTYRISVYRDGELDFHIEHLTATAHPNHSLSVDIEGLKGGQNYSIRIAAVNEAGAGPSSEVLLETGIKPPARPTRRPQVALDQGGVVRVTSRSIFIQMPNCFFSDSNGPIDRVQVIVSESAVMDYKNLSSWRKAFYEQPGPYVTDQGFLNPPCLQDQARLAPIPHARTSAQEEARPPPPEEDAQLAPSIPTPPEEEARLPPNTYAHTHTYGIGMDDGCLNTDADMHCNGPLKPKTFYVFKFRATNTRGQYTDSEYSERVQTADTNLLTRDEQIILGVLLSFFLAVFLILLIYASVRIHQKKLDEDTYSPREAEIIDTKFKLDQLIAVADLEVKEEKINRYSSFFFRRKEIFVIQLLSYRKSLKPVNKKDFEQHVEDLCANDHAKFQEEFSELPKLLPDLATSDADLPWNRAKNRFSNIKPYNNNRVKLLSEPGIAGSDYINASFVSGYLCPNEFIATQGPLPGTVSDFWRMILETRTKTIAMLTQCFEKGRIRCHQYWPEDSKPMTVFGHIIITKLDEKVTPDWIVRVLRVERHGEYMVVHHFNYTSWPEHGVPESSTTLIQFVKSVRSSRAHDNTTIVVHCSAGVGRTGVFIALDHLIQHVRDHDFVDIYGLVAELRSERMCMVQNLAQYMFLHQSTLYLLSSKGNSQSIWFVNYSALEKMDSLDAMEGDVELEWEETTM
ncbi:phosphatidylinositol phosphatase PTPRQ [Engraulis encrasicolus]|uniref:phosphatidylinositol phosphatase PTPRQ n=1 Tax=Engraulis encrasicolus TaxID=184585 RepID=UPI002FD561AA